MTESFPAKIKVSGAELDCEVHLDDEWKVCKVTTHAGRWRIANRDGLYERLQVELEDDIAESRAESEGDYADHQAHIADMKDSRRYI